MKQVRTDIVLNIAVADRTDRRRQPAREPARGRERPGQERRPDRQAERGGQPVRLPRQPADRAGLRADPLQGRRDQPRDRLHAPDQGDHELTRRAPRTGQGRLVAAQVFSLDGTIGGRFLGTMPHEPRAAREIPPVSRGRAGDLAGPGGQPASWAVPSWPAGWWASRTP